MDAAPDAPEARTYRSQGLRLHFTDWGNPSAPPLILIHGSLDHSRSWDQLAQALRTKFHVIAPDLRGHGDSDWATGSSYSQADHVYDLTCLVKSEGFEKVTIVGHSMGGKVAPHRLRKAREAIRFDTGSHPRCRDLCTVHLK